MRHDRIPYFPALDGIRGVGVLIVLFGHAGVSWAQGGFLFVSLFFTLSGFLITSLLLREREQRGRIDLKAFWSRRFRRLMPAALVGLGLVVVFGVFAADATQLQNLRGDVLSALAYVANWRFIFSGQAYEYLFADPSPVLHFWSLAIEEQFYLIFPLVVFAILGWRRGSRRAVFVVLALVAVASTVWMAHLAVGGADISRLYYGTDTRMAELAVGALLAVLIAGRFDIENDKVRTVVTWAGGVGFAFVIYLTATVRLAQPGLYRGGFLAFSILVALVILAAIQKDGPLRRTVDSRACRWVGLLSYGAYVYHWPIYLWLDPERTGLDGFWLLALRLSVTIGLAWISLRLIETPVRRGDALPKRKALVVAPTAFAVVAVSVIAVTVDPPQPAIVFDTSTAEPPDLSELPESTSSGLLPSEEADLVTEVTPDSPADVMAVLGGNAASLVPGLQRWAAETELIDVQVITDVPCGEVAAVEDAPNLSCRQWNGEFPGEMAASDPDVVVVMSEYEIAGAGAGVVEGESAAPPSSFADQLATVAGGSPVIVIDHPATAGSSAAALGLTSAQSIDLRDQYFWRDDLVASDAEGSRFTAEGAYEVVSWLAPQLTALAGGAEAPPLPIRLLVVGDSFSHSVGRGLVEWGLESGLAFAVNAAIPGCGIARGGEVMLADGPVAVDPACGGWADAWAELISDFQPHVVVVTSGGWDLGRRRQPGWDDFKSMGDPVFDEWLMGEYGEAIDVLAAQGATVVWMTPPCSEEGMAHNPLSGTDGTNNEAIRQLGDMVIDEVAPTRAGVMTVIDTNAELCPGGSYLPDYRDVVDARPDGVHFSDVGSYEFATWLGPQLLTAAGG
ncbi:MAG: hypothetical protein JJLCMIEE_00695 [Acidimicrobiales bacterium]|nr:MAG: acyltransferase family protein [Actinomycetota bacterium]MBV6507643.1 hypothetical protein [Acidimicrobiales bacterium]RIK07575.1 MAG: hypothetical protein DCC48_03505 [Acidobacteriota bacterium]